MAGVARGRRDDGQRLFVAGHSHTRRPPPTRRAERRRIAVKIAEERLKVAISEEADTDTAQVRLRFAEESAKKARHDYLRGLASKTLTASQVEFLRLKAEVAKRKFELMQNPVHLMSILDHMHWEIERLNDAVTALELKVQEIER